MSAALFELPRLESSERGPLRIPIQTLVVWYCCLVVPHMIYSVESLVSTTGMCFSIRIVRVVLARASPELD